MRSLPPEVKALGDGEGNVYPKELEFLKNPEGGRYP